MYDREGPRPQASGPTERHARRPVDDLGPEAWALGPQGLRPSWVPSGIDAHSTRCARSGQVGRRRALVGLSGILLATLGGERAWAQASRSCVLTPDAGEGPFYLDPKLIRSDITSGQPGAPLDLALQVVRAGDCATLANARVDVWHADALGLYSGYSQQSGVGGVSPTLAVGKQYLRGTQFTDASGNVRFRTIFPSWYGGRTPHVHFKVFLANKEVVASQVFFPDAITKEVFGDWQPYREHAAKRKTFNDNDPIKQGVHSQVERQRGGYGAKAVLVVASR
jgi:protocatechuate 3,4-dioxygenase beta subunit